ncbi:MAG: enoyl-CoA hydratase/isomerase family protein [Acidimicrobiales bacterium]
MTDKIHLDIDGPIATITNDNTDKHNAFDDEMDARLFAIFDELIATPSVRAVIWRGEGKSWSSGRDVAAIGNNVTELTHHELMTRATRASEDLGARGPDRIVAIQGWAIGGSFQRASCATSASRPTTPGSCCPVGHGVIPDTGGMGVLYEMCGHGLVSDMVLTGRRLSAEEALAHGIVSRIVDRDELDATAREMAEKMLGARRSR